MPSSDPLISSQNKAVFLKPLSISVLLFLMVLALGFFLMSIWGEQHFKGGPEDQKALVEYVVKGKVSILTKTDQAPVTTASSITDTSLFEPFEQGIPLASGVTFRTENSSELGIFFDSSDLIRLLPNTEVVFQEVNLRTDPMQLKIILHAGSVWISTIQGRAAIDVVTNRIKINPEKASSLISYKDALVNVFAAHHPVRLTFLDDTDKKNVLNDYLLTESYQVEINEKRLNPQIEQLQYTKLTKEYPSLYVSPENEDQSWSIALKTDLDRLNQKKSDFISKLRREGDAGYTQGTLKYTFFSYYKIIRNWLTLDKQHLFTLEEDETLQILYQALYLMSQGKEDAGLARLNQFKQGMNIKNQEKLKPLSHVFQAVLWGDKFYSAKETLRAINAELAASDTRLSLQLSISRDRLNEIYDLLGQGELARGKQALVDYNKGWLTLIQKERTKLVDWIKTLTEERQILQNLLYREDTFYQVNLYAVLTQLEDTIISFTADESSLNEARQAFIQDKIRVLNRLIALIDQKKVSIETGTDLGYLLLADAQEMLKDITNKTAIMDYFVSQLAELGLEFQFIGSSDYRLADQGTFEEKYATYLAKEQDLAELILYIRSLKNQEVPQSSITLDEAIIQSEKAFNQEGIYFVALYPLGDPDYRLFSIEGGRVNLTPIKGNYDRVTGIIYDFKIDGQAFSVGVKLENLKQAVIEFTQSQTSTGVTIQSQETNGETSSSSSSSAETLALNLVREDLVNNVGLIISETGITIADLEKNIFIIASEISSQGKVFKVNFSYAANERMASGITATYDDYEFTVGDIAVTNLAEEVASAFLGE